MFCTTSKSPAATGASLSEDKHDLLERTEALLDEHQRVGRARSKDAGAMIEKRSPACAFASSTKDEAASWTKTISASEYFWSRYLMRESFFRLSLVVAFWGLPCPMRHPASCALI